MLKVAGGLEDTFCCCKSVLPGGADPMCFRPWSSRSAGVAGAGVVAAAAASAALAAAASAWTASASGSFPEIYHTAGACQSPGALVSSPQDAT